MPVIKIKYSYLLMKKLEHFTLKSYSSITTAFRHLSKLPTQLGNVNGDLSVSLLKVDSLSQYLDIELMFLVFNVSCQINAMEMG